ncbi:MAG: dTMP kinase [Candidatus Aramenus sulfurataquae]|uniref:Probable thymidylate kinase n=1 Tax=Candidatus Aramenus sulfurataquae TaxID=1326980 RepID=W7L8Y8_9CREN|nr:MAG: dTMP kinase [Candidatus Aramenus sulfurataquae]
MILVAFEGIDGAGKTTLSQILFSYLTSKGINALLTQEPFTKEITQLIESQGWKDPITLTLLFAADRSIHLDWIRSKRAEVVITDRYLYSSVAYQSAMGAEEEWIFEVNSKFPKPDMTILIDVKVETAMKRLSKKKDIFNFEEKLKLLSKVRKKYLELAKKEGFKVINGERELEEVSKEVIYSVEKFLGYA